MPETDLTRPTLSDDNYDAQIGAIDFKFANPRFLCIQYRIPFRARDYFVWDELPYSAPVKSVHYQRTAQGINRLHQILTPFGKMLPPSISDEDLEELLVGLEVLVKIQSKLDGVVSVPKVFKVLGKARQPVQGPYE